MTKEQVKTLVETLHGDSNFPLRVFVDSGTGSIDESAKTQFTKWDHENGILYSIRLPAVSATMLPSNAENCISIFAVDYATIYGIEAVRVPLDRANEIFDKIEVMNDTDKEMIGIIYKFILNHDITEITPTNLKKYLGEKINDQDDYYNNKYEEAGNVAPKNN